MNGNKAVLDSNIIIDASKGLVSIQDIVDEYDFLFISVISYVEVLGYRFSNDEERLIIEEVITNMPIVHVDINIANFAVDYRRNCKIKLPDALILATAKILNSRLLTRNINDFMNIDNTVSVLAPKIIL